MAAADWLSQLFEMVTVRGRGPPATVRLVGRCQAIRASTSARDGRVRRYSAELASRCSFR